jgi:hypothetical protein
MTVVENGSFEVDMEAVIRNLVLEHEVVSTR